MFGRAIAEFEFSLTFTDAPIDRFARGEREAMTISQKRGAILFFGKANCVSCHAVSGQANEMFSDFKEHVAGVPQIAPFFGIGKGNVIFDGPDTDEDFGLEQVSGNGADRYHFRTAPLRDLRVQPAFFHNGSFTRLEDAIRFHLDALTAARQYDPRRAGVEEDLSHRLGPIEPVQSAIDPTLAGRVNLTSAEFDDLLAFARDGLADPRVTKENLCRLIPASLPSGRQPLNFTGCDQQAATKSPPRAPVVALFISSTHSRNSSCSHGRVAETLSNGCPTAFILSLSGSESPNTMPFAPPCGQLLRLRST
jgi:cytochrome c peroxidase